MASVVLKALCLKESIVENIKQVCTQHCMNKPANLFYPKKNNYIHSLTIIFTLYVCMVKIISVHKFFVRLHGARIQY